MSDKNFKQLFSILLLAFTVLWSAACLVLTLYVVLKNQDPALILAAAGADTVSGSLITWTSNVINHYFRKAYNPDVATTGSG